VPNNAKTFRQSGLGICYAQALTDSEEDLDRKVVARWARDIVEQREVRSLLRQPSVGCFKHNQAERQD